MTGVGALPPGRSSFASGASRARFPEDAFRMTRSLSVGNHSR
jgi:hypothetical protein